MNSSNSLLLLVNSLTKAEKRYFQLCSNLQGGDKVYLSLFNLIEDHLTPEDLYNRFCKKNDGKNFEIAVKHLYRSLLDSLVRLREKQDIQTKLFNYISRAGILFEREMFDESFAELDKAKKMALTYENDPLLLLIYRTELKYQSALNYETISEKQLVNKQMKINEIMKYSKCLNQHTQLYDILRHRLIYKGFARSEKQKEALNDLVLSELHLVANNTYKGFEAEKLHLLFQATYYLNSGNYKSAILHYQEIMNLFKENDHLIQNPPIYYLGAIQGILDSLQSTGLYHEMPFFINKLNELAQNNYSTELILHIKAMSYLFQSNALLQTGEFLKALEIKEKHEDSLFSKISSLNPEPQLRLYLNSVILYMYLKDFSQARKYMKKILSSGKLYQTQSSFKIARLVNLILQAELENYNYFESEISSIKRNIGFEKQVYITEKLLFKFVQDYPLPSYEKARNKLWQQYQKDIKNIEQDKYERHLLKTFDVLSWIKHKLTHRPLAEILEEKNKPEQR